MMERIGRIWNWFKGLYTCQSCGKSHGSNWENCRECEEFEIDRITYSF